MVSSTSVLPVALSLAVAVFGHPLEQHGLAQRGQQHQLNSTDSYTLVKNSGTNSVWPYRKYMTTNATSPQFVVQRNGEPIANGSIFLTLQNLNQSIPGENEQGAVIMSSEGDLVWAGPMGGTSNFRKQTYKGEDVITTWTGDGSAASSGGAAHGYGMVQIFNTKYEVIQKVCPTVTALNIKFSPGTNSTCVADVHESYITEQNTMLVTVYNQTRADLTSQGGSKDGYITNSVLVEVDIETSKPIFIWNPQDHVPISASHQPLNGLGYNASNPYDWFHMNAIQSFNGGYLVNSRQTWSSYFVNKQGKIEWELNGKTGGSFGSLPKGYNFSFQHDARLHSGASDSKVLYTVFNDYNGDFSTHNPSTGITLILDLPTNGTNSTNFSSQPYTNLIDHNQTLPALAEGSYQLIGEDKETALLGYGVYPIIKEFDLKGATANTSTAPKYTAQFAYANYTANSYRSFKYAWNATPCVPVDVVVVAPAENSTMAPGYGSSASGTGKTAYVSWNGATDVTTYAIYAQENEKGESQDTGYFFDRKGFETSFEVPAELTAIQIVAMAKGRELGRSSTVVV